MTGTLSWGLAYKSIGAKIGALSQELSSKSIAMFTYVVSEIKQIFPFHDS